MEDKGKTFFGQPVGLSMLGLCGFFMGGYP